MKFQSSLRVNCGFDAGSYTVTLDASDPGAAFAPKTFVVNFGRLVGDSRFSVTFASVGVHRVWATVTPKMGSPAVAQRFVAAASGFDVVAP